MNVIHHVVSDVGRKRRDNEDCFLVDAERGLYVVADGMGGHAAGEVASRITVDVVAEIVRERWVPGAARPGSADATLPPQATDPDMTAPPMKVTVGMPGTDVLRLAITTANDRVLDMAREKRECRGMAATVVAVLLDGPVAHVAHAGDSRAYRLRDGALVGLTADHSWVGEQIQKGAITVDEARTHPLRNMVTRAVGGRKELEAAVDTVPVLAGDVLLLCTDGLTGMVPDDEIARMVEAAESPEAAVTRLVAEANARGGVDNVTVLVLRFVDAPA